MAQGVLCGLQHATVAGCEGLISLHCGHRQSMSLPPSCTSSAESVNYCAGSTKETFCQSTQQRLQQAVPSQADILPAPG